MGLGKNRQIISANFVGSVAIGGNTIRSHNYRINVSFKDAWFYGAFL
jgi:hypothetical protein